MKMHFLEYVAQDVFRKYGSELSQIAIVFPNKRARLFFNQYLARQSEAPVWSPAYFSISELFQSQSQLTIPDKIKLVCELYQSYKKFVPTDETIDEFYAWGEVLLNDFDDIDKAMANARQLFLNLEGLHELDTDDFLTEEQRKVLRRFFKSFEDGDTLLKSRFSLLWTHLYDIYEDFNHSLQQKGLAYEGALYRQVVEQPCHFQARQYLFVGFNILQKVEQELIHRIQEEGKARFYWDFDHYYLNAEPHGSEAGTYIRQYLERFPNELDSQADDIYNNLAKPKNITYISANTEHVQARYVGHWIQQQAPESINRNTAVVLCDEGLLPAVLHSIPESVGPFNITAGLPLSKMPVCSFINTLLSLRTFGTNADGKRLKRRFVLQVLQHPCAQFYSDEIPAMLNEIQNDILPTVPLERLSTTEALSQLFNMGGADLLQDVPSIISWLIGVMETIGLGLQESTDILLKESVFKMYTVLQRIQGLTESGDLQVNSTTLQKLLKQLTRTTTIPFHGEPAQGLQVMGVLETRNLDFKNVILLSCNEGNIPRGQAEVSVIPFSLRKAFGLTTTEHTNALYSYHFHRLIQRAENIVLLYNQATSDMAKGEMSRYMLQLLVESEHKIKRQNIVAGQTTIHRQPVSIAKTQPILDILYSKHRISPSAINIYLRCPVRFYYSQVAHLKELQSGEDPTDQRLFGNIFHSAAQRLYQGVQALRDDKQIANLAPSHPAPSIADIDRAITDALIEFHLLPRNAKAENITGGMNIISRTVFTDYLKRLVRIDTELMPTTILAVEKEVVSTITFPLSDGEKSITIGGIVDRLDAPQTNPPLLRVLDYKTGRPAESRINSIEDIFRREKIGNVHSDYYLQALLYSVIVRHSSELNPGGLPVAPSLLFVRKFNTEKPLAILEIGGQPINDIQDVEQEFMHHLRLLLSEIHDPAIPFHPTTDKDHCKLCPYKNLCY